MTAATMTHTLHDTIVMEGAYPASPSRAFAAWESVDARLRWSIAFPEAGAAYDATDFRVEGHEHGHFRPEGVPFMLSNDVWYLDIAGSARIVPASTMAMDGKPMAHSPAVTEFFPESADSRRLVFAEQGAYHGGEADIANRRTGTEGLFDKLAADLDTHA